MPRYDEKKNETRHAAASEEQCEEMSKKYKWRLKGADRTQDNVLPVDCVFNGRAEFPKSHLDLIQGECDDD